MERLTRPCADMQDGKYAPYVAGEFIGIYPDCTLGKVVQKLAAYEDTGLEPEEIAKALGGKKAIFDLYFGVDQKRIAHLMELRQAEEDGRLVVLPCKVDATVYDIRRFYKGRKIVRKEIVSGAIDHFTIGEAQKPIATVCLHGNEWADYEPDDLILTREEAEAALGGCDE